MEEVSVAQLRRKEKKNRIVFVILCVLIAALLVTNILFISNAYFTATKSTSPSLITLGNVDVTLYNSSDVEITDAISFDSGGKSVLIPGNSESYSLKVVNTGNVNSYIRLSMVFEIKQNNVFVEKNFVTMSTSDSTNFVSNGGYLYYRSAVAANGNFSVPLTFTVDTSLGNMDSEGIYTNCQYKITVLIEAVQSQGVTLGPSGGWTFGS